MRLCTNCISCMELPLSQKSAIPVRTVPKPPTNFRANCYVAQDSGCRRPIGVQRKTSQKYLNSFSFKVKERRCVFPSSTEVSGMRTCFPRIFKDGVDFARKQTNNPNPAFPKPTACSPQTRAIGQQSDLVLYGRPRAADPLWQRQG